MFMLGLAGLFMTACSETEEGWADPQHFDPEDAITVPGFSASSISSVIDLAQVEDEGVAIYAIPDGISLPDGFTLQDARVILTPQVDGEEAANLTVETTLEGLASKEELHDIIANIWNTNPNEVRKFVGQVYYNAVKDGQAVLIDAGQVEISIKIDAPKIFSKYYMVGSFDGWTCTRVEGMELVNGGGDPYAGDSKFTIMFEPTETAIADGSVQFKVVPADSFNEDGNIVDGGWDVALSSMNQVATSETEGKFSYKNEYDNFKFDLVEDAVSYKITFDMLDGTFEIKPVSAAPEVWYLIGSPIGDGSWSNDLNAKSLTEILTTAVIPLAHKEGTVITYTGYFAAGKGFKLIHTPGSWAEQWGKGADGFVKNDGGSGDITVEEDGFYTVTLDYAKDELTIEKAELEGDPKVYDVLGICGNFQDWKPEKGALVEMTKMANNDHVWVATLELEADSPLKFLTDYSWTVNWGNPEAFPTGIGTKDADNIPATAGKYVVVFNDITGGFNFIDIAE